MGKRTYTYDGSEWVGLTSTTADLSNYANMTTTPISGFRNAIINGDFRIWQRGTSFSAAGYTADRWIILADGSGATRSISQQVFTPGNAISGYEPVNFLRYNQSVAGTSATFNIIEQRIEDVRTYAGQTVTVSFWAKTDSARTVTSQVQQNFGTGGSAEVEAINPSNIALTTSWQRFTYTATMPSISGKTIGTNAYVAFRINIPTNATFTVDVWGVQLEKGTIATPFEQRPIGMELTLCHRYFQRFPDPAGIGVSTGSAATRVLMPLYTRMRAIPTTVISGTFNFWNGSSTGTSTVLAGVYNSISHGQLDFTGGAGTSGQASALYTNGGSQYADFSAEL